MVVATLGWTLDDRANGILHALATQKVNFNFSLEKSDHKSSIAISKQEGLVSKQRIKYKEITAVIKVFII